MKTVQSRSSYLVSTHPLLRKCFPLVLAESSLAVMSCEDCYGCGVILRLKALGFMLNPRKDRYSNSLMDVEKAVMVSTSGKHLGNKTEIDKIADGFIETGFFDLSVAKYVYALKNSDKYEISISVIQGMENDTEALQPFVDLRTDMDNYFPDNRIEFKLVVDNLENVVKTLK